MKAIKVPDELINAPYYHREIQLKGIKVVESCTHTQRRQGKMYLEDHLLMVVLEGQNKLTISDQQFVVNKNEMILLNRATLVDYDKCGNPEGNDVYDSLMFFIKDEFLSAFLAIAQIETLVCAEAVTILVKPVKAQMLEFFDSLKPLFNEPDELNADGIRYKMLELLHELAKNDKNLFARLLQLKQPVYSDIATVVEKCYVNPVTLTDLAYLSGRSLSSFKRDFFSIYHMPPAQYIREKRLTKAKELLCRYRAAHILWTGPAFGRPGLFVISLQNDTSS